MSASNLILNPIRTGTNAKQVGQTTALQMLQASQNPRDILLAEALNGVMSAIQSINQLLGSAPTLKLLLVDSADIANLTVGSSSGPGQMTVNAGPPSYPEVGWVGQNPSSPAPLITITNFTAGTGTTSTAHNLAANQIVLIAGTSDSTLNGYWKVATVPTGTTLTLSGYSGNATGGTLQRQFFGAWYQTIWLGGASPLDAITNGAYCDESGNLTVNAAVVKGTLSAATVLAAALNITAILVTGLTLTNNSPIAGNVAWSSCTVYYQGTAYSISSGNTTGGNKLIYWTVGGTSFSQANSYTPGPTIFGIATNNQGTGDITWNKVGAVSVQSSQMTNGLLIGFQVQPPAGANVDLTVAASTTIVSITTATAPNGGGLLTLGFSVTTAVSGGSPGSKLDITVDGQPTESITLYGSVPTPNFVADAVNVSVSSSGSGSSVGDALHFQMNIGFTSSLVIKATVTGLAVTGAARVTALWASRNSS